MYFLHIGDSRYVKNKLFAVEENGVRLNQHKKMIEIAPTLHSKGMSRKIAEIFLIALKRYSLIFNNIFSLP